MSTTRALIWEKCGEIVVCATRAYQHSGSYSLPAELLPLGEICALSTQADVVVREGEEKKNICRFGEKKGEHKVPNRITIKNARSILHTARAYSICAGMSAARFRDASRFALIRITLNVTRWNNFDCFPQGENGRVWQCFVKYRRKSILLRSRCTSRRDATISRVLFPVKLQ